MPLSLRLSCLLVAIALLTGCAGLATQREPVRVTLSDIRLLESTLLEQLYRVRLRIQNPNEQPLTLRGASFDLALNGKAFGSGVAETGVTVPAFGDAQVDVRMVSTLFGMVRLIQGLQERGGEPLHYELSGRLSVEGLLTGIRFRESGELALPGGGERHAL